MVGTQPRMTQTTQAVLHALLDGSTEGRYGLEICAVTGLPSGTVHPILARFETLGWLDSAWEQVDPREQGRPRRRYYRMSQEGAALARDALARAHRTRDQLLSRWKPAGEAG